VAKAGTSKAWGNYVLIKGSDGNTYRYGHLSSLGVATGATVGGGSDLGASGGKKGAPGSGNSTGPHLHFEVRSAAGAEVNPMSYVSTSGTPGAATAAGQEEAGPPGITYDDYSQAFLDAYPEVADIVDQAIANKWTQSQFDAHIKNTRWWQERSTAQQEWDTKIKDNPGQAAREVAEMQANITQWAAAKGITISAAQAQQLATEFTRNGVKAGTAEFEMRLGGFYTTSGTATGEAAVNEDFLRKKAGDYGVTVSDAQLQGWTQDILSGKGTAEGFEDSIREQAKTLYKPISSDLDRGLTTRDVVMPFLGIAGHELGIDLSNVSLTDPKWTQAIFGPDGKTMMTADQWTSTVRSDGRYGWDKTANARSTAADLTGQLAQAFGALG
jgi:Peptidase family M23